VPNQRTLSLYFPSDNENHFHGLSDHARAIRKTYLIDKIRLSMKSIHF
jgi:hypothetical protein